MGDQSPGRFPRSPEIKRLIKAARDAGIQVGSIDIRHDGVTIYPAEKSATGQSAYDIWKAQNAG